jgi:DNA-directed RNA polymerase II subunit RPB1
MNPKKRKTHQIIGVQFSMLSPKFEIIRWLKLQAETYINNKPVIGGLFDHGWEQSIQKLFVPTDGLSYIVDTPGYFRVILVLTCILYTTFKEIVKMIKCVCFKCSKFLLIKHNTNISQVDVKTDELYYNHKIKSTSGNQFQLHFKHY